jgi:serine/threonine protein kinase
VSDWLGNAAVAHLRDVAEWPDLGARYEVRGRLGRGGMSVVYEAWDRVLNRTVAVKVLDQLFTSTKAADRLLAEAKILSRLEHPAIVPVHDAGLLPDSRVFYVMKAVRGERLDRAIGGKSLQERLDVFLRICDAVAFAHVRGIVHRDLKPENIMLGSFGEVLVMDWGVAKADEVAGDHDLIVGTPGFMAPEQQVAGTPVDERADVFALGAILETLLPEPRAKALVAVSQRARAARVDERYNSVAALAADVARFREGEKVSAYRESLPERLVRVWQRHRLPISLVLAYMFMRVLVLLWFRT